MRWAANQFDRLALLPMAQPGWAVTESVAKESEFTTLFREQYRGVEQYVATYAPRSDVDDVVSDVFLVAWRRWDDLEETMAQAWLLGVARNVLRSRYRSRRRFDAFIDRLSTSAVAETLGGPEPTAVQADLVRRGMRRLDERDAEILVLSAWHDLGPSEIAVVLGVTRNHAGVRLFRARERLRVIVSQVESSAALS